MLLIYLSIMAEVCLLPHYQPDSKIFVHLQKIWNGVLLITTKKEYPSVLFFLSLSDMIRTRF